MKRFPVTIDGVDYLFIPYKCEIHPVISTDVIVERWVKEFFDEAPGRDCVKQEVYYPMYRDWGGNLSKTELVRALVRLGYDAKRCVMHKGRRRRLWSGVRLKTNHKTTMKK